MRNIEKAIEEGKRAATQRTRLDLRVSETKDILANTKDVNEAVTRAYWAGLAVGLRNKC